MTGTAPGGTHVPVMLGEVSAMFPPPRGVILDATFGGGGYSRAVLEADAGCTVWAIDRDPAAIARGAALARRFPGRLHLLQGGFGDLLALLAARGVTALDGAMFDVGVSSQQIDDPARGFSFRADGPLDMRMGDTGATAAQLVAELPEAELAAIFHELGEERHARRIARAIVQARAAAPIETTLRLAAIVRGVVPADRSGIDPATRSFQGLRIRVNDELGQIRDGIAQAAGLLRPGGRLAVVSFHSLEDRIVKRFMLSVSDQAPSPSRYDPASLVADRRAGFHLLTRRALRPTDAETHANPRARSARLRAIEKTELAA